jgi:beta-lactamase class A
MPCWRHLVLGLSVALLAALPAQAAPGVDATPGPPWVAHLEARMAELDADFSADLGLYVRALEPGETFSWRAEQAWYLASLVKVPVAIELLARVEAGRASLEERLTLHERDYVDGAGPTNWAPPGSELSLRALLEAMLTVSDNTASDMLIRHFGLAAVNRRARSLVGGGDGLGPITPLVDVRRHVYAALHPDARSLTGLDFIELQKRDSDAERLDWLAERLEVPPASLRLASLDDAFDAYYATSLNAGRLDAFGDLLTEVAEGRALGPAATTELMTIMARTSSGDRRLKAGLGPGVRFAHKTGTQHRRACDAGIAIHGEGAARRRVVIVACTRGERDVARSERALAAIGRAIREAGLFTGDGGSTVLAE